MKKAGQSLGPGRLILFAAPGGGGYIIYLTLALFIAPFYAETLSFDLTTIGLIAGGLRLWDIVTDILVAGSVDRVRTRFGRRKPLMLLGLPLALIPYWLTFNPWQGFTPFDFVWLSLILYIGTTLYVIVHKAWSAEIVEGYHARSRVQGALSVAVMVTALITFGLPAAVETTGIGGPLDNAGRAHLMVGLAIALMLLTTLGVILFVREEPVITADPPDIPALLRRAAVDFDFRNVMIIEFFVRAGAGFVAVLFVLFAKDVLALESMTSAFLLIYFLANIVGVPIVFRVSRRFDKPLTLAGMQFAGAALSLMAIVIPPGNIGLVLVLVVGLGIAGAVHFLTASITTDLVADDARKGSGAAPGFSMGILNLVGKLGQAVPLIIALPMLDALGYDPDAASATAAPLRWIYALGPALCWSAAGLLASRLRIRRPIGAEATAE